MNQTKEEDKHSAICYAFHDSDDGSLNPPSSKGIEPGKQILTSILLKILLAIGIGVVLLIVVNSNR